MAKKTIRTGETKPKKEEVLYCKDCTHSYDPHEIGFDGKPFLCRCRIHTKRSWFLNRSTCSHFKAIKR